MGLCGILLELFKYLIMVRLIITILKIFSPVEIILFARFLLEIVIPLVIHRLKCYLIFVPRKTNLFALPNLKILYWLKLSKKDDETLPISHNLSRS